MDNTAKRRKNGSKSRVSDAGNSSSHSSPVGGGNPFSKTQDRVVIEDVNGQDQADIEDPFAKLAQKIRNLKECLVSKHVMSKEAQHGGKMLTVEPPRIVTLRPGKVPRICRESMTRRP